MQQLLGVVLCGGESRRMGSDKGLLPIGDGTWANYVGYKLSALQIPVVYSINANQQLQYIEIISEDHLVVDSFDLPGPVRGLFSVHQKFPNKNLLLLACDMLNVQAVTLQKLLHSYIANGFDYYAFRDENFYQTFCAIYTSKGLKNELLRLNERVIENYSLQTILQTGFTCPIEIEDVSAFANYNEPV